MSLDPDRIRQLAAQAAIDAPGPWTVDDVDVSDVDGSFVAASLIASARDLFGLAPELAADWLRLRDEIAECADNLDKLHLDAQAAGRTLPTARADLRGIAEGYEHAADLVRNILAVPEGHPVGRGQTDGGNAVGTLGGATPPTATGRQFAFIDGAWVDTWNGRSAEEAGADDDLDAAATLVATDGWCGCGSPYLVTAALAAYLAQPERILTLGDSLEDLLIAYRADELGLTEHGGTVAAAWLTDAGKAWLQLTRTASAPTATEPEPPRKLTADEMAAVLAALDTFRTGHTLGRVRAGARHAIGLNDLAELATAAARTLANPEEGTG